MTDQPHPMWCVREDCDYDQDPSDGAHRGPLQVLWHGPSGDHIDVTVVQDHSDAEPVFMISDWRGDRWLKPRAEIQLTLAQAQALFWRAAKVLAAVEDFEDQM